MPNLPISGLPAASSLDGSELFAAVQSGVTTYTTLDDVSGFGTGSFMTTGSISGQTLTFTKGDGSTFNIYLTPGGLFPTSYGLFNQTGSSVPVSGSTAEGSLIGGGVGIKSVAANGFSQGDAFHAIFTGLCTFNNNDTLRIRVKADGNVLADTGAFTVANASNKRWKLEIYFSIQEIGGAGTASIVSSGTFMYTKNASTDFQGVNFGTENTSSFDTTVDNELEVTAQFSSVNNSIYSRLFTLNKTY